MACGTPVIASEVGGLAYLIRDGVTGFHVPDRDPVALASAIAQLAHDPALRQRLGRQAHQYAQYYSWECIADRIMALYSKALLPAPVLRLPRPIDVSRLTFDI